MSQLDQNLEALHRKVDAHLNQLALKRRAIAEATRSTESETDIPDQEVDPENVSETSAGTAPSEIRHLTAAPSPQPTQPIVPISTSRTTIPPAQESGERVQQKPAAPLGDETPRPSSAEQGPAPSDHAQNDAIRPPANAEDSRKSLGIFGKILRRLRWW